MIASWSDCRAYVAADCRSRGAPLSLRGWLFDPVLRFQVLMRIDEFLLNTAKPRLLRFPLLLWFRRLSVRLGFSMGPNIFGPGLSIVHYGTIVIEYKGRTERITSTNEQSRHCSSCSRVS